MAEQTAPQTESAATPEPPDGMVHVPGGPFLIGKKKEEVSLGEFWIDTYPVTNGDYEEFLTAHRKRAPRHWPASGLTDAMRDLPIVMLTYEEATAYAETLGKALPTPAQFEKAARGAEGLKYPWGDEVRNRVTNTKESGIGKLTSVDTFSAGKSPYGCYDMAGNVLHWTRGVYDADKGTQVVMGGSYKHYLGTTSWSYEEPPEKRRDYVGFRCVWRP